MYAAQAGPPLPNRHRNRGDRNRADGVWPVRCGEPGRRVVVGFPGMATLDDGYVIDPGVDIGHVHLKVADIARSLDFYCGMLGFELMAALRPLGGIHQRRRLPPPHRPQHLGVARRIAAGTRHHRTVSHRDPLPDAQAARDRADAAARRRVADHRGQRPRRQRGDLPQRSRSQRGRALLGPAERPVAAPGRARRSRCSRPRSTSPTSSAKPTYVRDEVPGTDIQLTPGGTSLRSRPGLTRW